jgi:hypothetical protein
MSFLVENPLAEDGLLSFATPDSFVTVVGLMNSNCCSTDDDMVVVVVTGGGGGSSTVLDEEEEGGNGGSGLTPSFLSFLVLVVLVSISL